MTTGEGGMVLTDDPDVAERARELRQPRPDAEARLRTRPVRPQLPDDEHARGHRPRADVDSLPEYNEARRANAARLTDELPERVETPIEPEGRRHVYHQYTIRAEDRDALADHLESAGVGTGVYYPTPIHEQPVYDDVDRDAPVAERAADEVLSLPVHPALSSSDIDDIVAAVAAAGVEA